MVCTNGLTLGVDWAGFGASVQGSKELAQLLRKAKAQGFDIAHVQRDPAAAAAELADTIDDSDIASVRDTDVLIFEQSPRVSLSADLKRCASRFSASLSYSYNHTNVRSELYGTESARHSHRFSLGLTLDHEAPMDTHADAMELRMQDTGALSYAHHHGDITANDLEAAIKRRLSTRINLQAFQSSLGFYYAVHKLEIADSAPPSGSRPKWTVTMGFDLSAGPAIMPGSERNDLTLDEISGAAGIMAIGRIILVGASDGIEHSNDIPGVPRGVVGPTFALFVESPTDGAHDLIVDHDHKDFYDIPLYSLGAAELTLAAYDTDQHRKHGNAGRLALAITNYDRALDTALRLTLPDIHDQYSPVIDTVKYGTISIIGVTGNDDIHLALQYRALSKLTTEVLLKPLAKRIGFLPDSEKTLW